MNGTELKAKYIEFFRQKAHAEIAGRSLIPENDPTVLFTTAGMHPLVPFILGEPHPAGRRLVNCQKCIRTGDIEEVGDTTHLTFFEMLGNWSLGDYFKQEAIEYSYEFLTDGDWLGLPADNLHVTVFAGDDEVPADREAADIWNSLGLPIERIHFLPRSDNWWGPVGETGPCGPDTEMFIDVGNEACSADCRPGCSCGKYVEIWNDVFMQYNRTEEGRYEPLEHPTVDTGMGVERTCAMLQGKKNVYETELFAPVLSAIQEATGRTYGQDATTDGSMRILADHVRSAVFLLGDARGVRPSNLGQGYVLRRLIRRAIRHGRKLAIERHFLRGPATAVIDTYCAAYPELEENRALVLDELEQEESRFLDTLKKGEHEFAKLLPNLLKNPRKVLPGRIAFRLYDTYGFPIEITRELAAEEGLAVDEEGFEAAFRKHQDLSKGSASKSFKGGLADNTEQVTRLHTATHLLHQALRTVLGDHVEQRGSNITSERLRFDFRHGKAMTPEEIEEVTRMVNEQIARDLPVHHTTMSFDEAREAGAMALFDDKYEEKVKVYSVGDFSLEVCGGPHVERTGALGRLRIVKEQSSSAGVRRIRAVLEEPETTPAD